MNDGKIIIDKIISDAEKVAAVTIAQAQKEVDAILKTAKDRAHKQLDQLDRDAHSEADRVRSKEISAADMQAKKAILETKQEILAEIIAEAEQRLTTMEDAEYAKVIGGMLSRVDKSLGKEIIVSAKDSARLADVVKENGFLLSEKTADIKGGFIVKNGDVEYNYSFESIITVEKEAIRQAAAEILF